MLLSAGDSLVCQTDAAGEVEVFVSGISKETVPAIPVVGRAVVTTTDETVLLADGEETEIQHVSITNRDVNPISVSLKYENTSVYTDLYHTNLQTGEKACFTRKGKWTKYSSEGRVVPDERLKKKFLSNVVFSNRCWGSRGNVGVVFGQSHRIAFNTSITTYYNSTHIFWDTGEDHPFRIRSLAKNQSGSSLTGGTIWPDEEVGTVPSGKYAVFLAQCSQREPSAIHFRLKAGANNYTTGYDTQELAFAATPDADFEYIPVWSIVVQATSGNLVIGTDSLTGAGLVARQVGLDFIRTLE